MWAFQMTFTGAIAAGYVHLLVAAREGPVDRRDLLGLAAGAVAVTSAGPGSGDGVRGGAGRAVWAGASGWPPSTRCPCWSRSGSGTCFDARTGARVSLPGAVLRFVWYGLRVTADRATAGDVATWCWR